ncbi:MAG: M48 family metallopeptidase [Acidobacteriaceae bacterium]|nr:M48 family metallopeptidase [Acidobacteriaceae bacterium]
MKLAVFLALGASVSLGAPQAKTAGNSIAAASQFRASESADVGEAQVYRWMRTWRKRLSLEDWEISTLLVRSTELKPDTLGNLRWNSGSKTATIRVLAPVDYDLPAWEIPADIEYTVVHELVHLQLAVLPHEAGMKNVEEQVVNRIAEALLALEKGPQYRPRSAVAHLPSKDKDKGVSEASRAAKQ